MPVRKKGFFIKIFSVILVIIVGIAITMSILLKNKENPKELNHTYTDKYRPQFHFSPAENWMNDPNGLVYDPSNETYHLYYQYNPSGLDIGNQVWAHAESKDMINWTQAENFAIIQDDGLGAIFSGSAVVDENNTSGLFSDNKPGESKLVALFTHDGGALSYGLEKQSLAYSKDHGHTWIKPSMDKEGFENPVISNEGDKYGRAFRDPKVFRYDDKWFMVIAGGDARIFTSDDLIHWDFAGDLNMHSECPDLFPLAVDGDANNIKWVYLASGKWYVIGDFKKDKVVDGIQHYKFVKESGELPYNGGPGVYATQSFFNDGSGNNRRMLISWIQDHSAHLLNEGEKYWNGVQTIPYETTLRTVNWNIRLFSYPVNEVKNIRTDSLLLSWSGSVGAESQNILKGYGGERLDIEAMFTPETATEFGFKLRKGMNQEITIKYDSVNNKFIIDQSKSGSLNSGVYSMDMYPMPDGKIKMRILADTSVLEAFGNGGEAVNSVMFFPDPESIAMEFFTNGTVSVDSLNIYKMGSIWNELPDNISDLHLPVSTKKIITGDTITLDAVFKNPSANNSIEWTISDKSVAELISSDDTSLTFKALKEGTSKIIASVPSLNASSEITITVISDTFSTNLSGLNDNTGVWYKDEAGLTTNGQNGKDTFIISDTKADVINSYEAVASPPDAGGCPSLLFGVTNPDSPSSGTWFGANVSTFGDNAEAKLFQNTRGSEKWNVKNEVPLSESYKLKITVSSDKVISFYVNDILIGEREASDYKEGYLGLLTWNSASSFNNVYYELN